uniref:Uncharacterized protein n=1 Tax=Ixodes scapularis TaxID=6945 RepID=A0A4D5RVY4_IXOSC
MQQSLSQSSLVVFLCFHTVTKSFHPSMLYYLLFKNSCFFIETPLKSCPWVCPFTTSWGAVRVDRMANSSQITRRNSSEDGCRQAPLCIRGLDAPTVLATT